MTDAFLTFGSRPFMALAARQQQPRAGACVVETSARRSPSGIAARCEAGNTFIFALDDELTWTANGRKPGAISQPQLRANCEAECSGGRIWITALRDIAAGEEITFNSVTPGRVSEHPCHCGAPGARVHRGGEFFDHVKRNDPLPHSCSAKNFRISPRIGGGQFRRRIVVPIARQMGDVGLLEKTRQSSAMTPQSVRADEPPAA